MNATRVQRWARLVGWSALGAASAYVLFLIALFVVMCQPPERFGQIWHVVPRYPEAMKSARVSGRVLLDGVVGADGRLKGLRVVASNHPDLAQVALDAVTQWRYDATRLNCTPVETRMQVQIDFQK
jgi:TonB family protein